jgi:hypothetical protein
MTNISDYDGSEQRAWVPLPLPKDYMEVGLLADRLGISGSGKGGRKDEVIAYRSIFGIAPLSDTPALDVEHTAESVYRFTPEQLECVNMLLRAFHLEFTDIDRFIDFLCIAKGMTRNEITAKGIPAPPKFNEEQGDMQ